MKTHATTILTVRHRGMVAIGGDGQVTLGNAIMKADAMKIRRLMDGKVITGFAGASGRRLRPAGAVRGQAEGLSRQRAAGGHRVGQGMADRSRACAGSRPCWPWSTPGTRCWSPATAT